MTTEQLKKDLAFHINKEKAAFFPRFFKTGKGQYGEGDKFIGVTVPNQRKIAKKYKDLPEKELKLLISSPIHEHRLTAIFILVHQYSKDPEKTYNFYLKNLKYVNNWDIVDSSAHKIIGQHLLNKKDRSLLHKFSKSKDLWERRIAMMSTYTFIKNKQFSDALKIATTLLNDSHDLIHKVVGWMLREIGKQDLPTLEKFLTKHHKTMPRTMLRYAIEKLSPAKRKHYMQK